MAVNYGPVANCVGLDAFQNFGDYMALVRNRTSFDETLLRHCQVPICGALWGYGLPDVSGIGVALGYTIATVIGPLLSLLLLASQHSCFLSKPAYTTSILAVLITGLASFFQSAVYFALAVEVATTITLVAKDYEFTTIAFGDYEARVSAIACTICLLPLLYPITILSQSESYSSTIPAIKDTQSKQGYRLCQFCFAVLASIYPFFSESVRTWAPTQIGEGAGDGGVLYVDEHEWAAIGWVCFGTVEYLTERESTILGAFHMVVSLFVVLFALCILAPPALRRLNYRYGEDSRVRGLMMAFCDQASRACQKSPLRYVVLAVPVCLAAPLLWGFWRLRALQRELATATGRDYEGDKWDFGQLIAVTIFVPVVAEMAFVATQGTWKSDKHGKSQCS
ncbi:hypothetical protein N658DRAFT_526761 [Parathielavia hyrcaniae]|uniref:Uncharacterized protein n=1 Tax=Parathielavia hyrcaniae TaxID=113614 RepID=A0AAN6PVH5_9PEZI|nr:hypothetical protein N658DRAFT_526761 [Parathielavia hyrcaniae]